MIEAAIHTDSLGKRYGSTWALEACNIEIPKGSLAALIGPNGAGKTTLLNLLSGLSIPTTGGVQVNGGVPRQTETFLASIGYLAQDIPLYKGFTINEHIAFGAHLNRQWDTAFIRNRLQALGLPFDRTVDTLSGGQRAQVALAMALAKRPKVLLLDEPVAALDPLARHEFLASLTHAVADFGMTVIMSSHVLSDLERICDYFVILAKGRTQLCDSGDTILANHKLLIGSRTNAYPEGLVIQETRTERQSTLLIRSSGPFDKDKWEVHSPSMEDIVLAYMGQGRQAQQTTPTKGDS